MDSPLVTRQEVPLIKILCANKFNDSERNCSQTAWFPRKTVKNLHLQILSSKEGALASLVLN